MSASSRVPSSSIDALSTHAAREKTPLPGWSILFQIRLALGTTTALLGTGWGLYLLVSPEIRLNTGGTAFIIISMILLAVLTALSASAFAAVWRRLPAALDLCRLLLRVELALLGLGVAICTVFFVWSVIEAGIYEFFEAFYGHRTWDGGWPLILWLKISLSNLVLTYAWLCYFKDSHKARRALSANVEPDSPQLSRPTGMALFAVLCGLLLCDGLTTNVGVAHWKSQNLLALAPHMDLLPLLIASGVLFPLIALLLLRLRLRRSLVWLIGIWTALGIFDNLAYWETHGSGIPTLLMQPNWPDLVFTPGIVLGGLFCLYFAVSEKAAAYMAAARAARTTPAGKPVE